MSPGANLRKAVLTLSVGACFALLHGCQDQAELSTTPSVDLASIDPATAPLHSVTIRRPTGPPRVQLAGTDPLGSAASVACSTCHSIREPRLATKTADALKEFHQGLTLRHGGLACYACHNPNDADTLRLADGTAVDYQDVMQLCGQCHGPQATAFAHGAHGGMNGYWDRRRGPQMKNNCIDCHDPHAPAFPKMVVNFKPRDRFQSIPEHSLPNDADAHEAAHDDGE